MKPVFVDTGAWFALMVKSDADHKAAMDWMRNNPNLLITTDYVLDELLTLLLTRVHPQMAIQAGQLLFESTSIQLEYLTSEDIQQAWTVFKQYTDKKWSFTDCTSKVIMERLLIEQAFSFDKHFEQFGSVQRVP